MMVSGALYAGLSLLVLADSALSNTTEAIEDVETATSEPPCTTCVKVDTTCYNRTYLLELEAPFRQKVVIKKMGIQRSNNVLYYSFEPAIADPEYYKVAFVKLDAPEQTGVLKGINDTKFNFGVFDINQGDGSIYLGGSDGIFVLNTTTNNVASYSSRGDTISGVVLKDYLYFSREGQKGIIKKKGDEFFNILEDDLVKDFVLDNVVEYVVVYLKATGLYAFDSKSMKKVRLSKNAFFRGLTVDIDGVVYAWWLDGLYKVVLDKNIVHSKIVKVADLPSVGAMVFDNLNNILFTNEKSLLKLEKTNLTNC